MTRPRKISAGSGLRVEKGACGWEVVHELSGLPLGFHLRLRRQAVTAMTDLYQTGVDFTLPAGELKKAGLEKAGKVSAKWRALELRCCNGGEHYSASTYAMDGRCMGPMSNGHQRRSLGR